MRNFIYKTLKLTKPLEELLHALRHEKHLFCLQSSFQSEESHLSFLGWDPIQTIQIKNLNDWEILKKTDRGMNKNFQKIEITPFPSGWVTYLAYELGQAWVCAPFQLKEAELGWAGLYDVVITIDHKKNIVHVVSSGLSEENSMHYGEVAQKRLNMFVEKLEELMESQHSSDDTIVFGDINAMWSKEIYESKVRQSLTFIERGDIYQVNLAMRFEAKIENNINPTVIYRRLTELSPAPLGGFLQTGSCAILSSSPERFFKIKNNEIVTTPMKGTRPRGKSEFEDHAYRQELLESEKDKAELLMITDLERNDLGRVCAYGSVHVVHMRDIEQYATVFQTTSTIKGILREDVDVWSVIENIFPSGSVTGCPKRRSMEIIAELEKHPRGPYTGSLGYVSVTGDADFNVLIRTIVCSRHHLTFFAGSGIVADSQPDLEYNEIQIKAQAMKTAVGSARLVVTT